MARSSGIGVYIRQLLPRVVQQLSDCAFHVLARPGELEALPELAPDRITLVVARSKLYGVGEQLELRSLIPRGTTLYWSPHYVAPLLYGGPMVATIHDLAHLALPQFFGQFHRRAYARLMFRNLRRRAAHVFCDSEFTARELEHLTAFPRSRLSVVHLGVADEWFRPDARGAVASDPPYLLFVGNVKPHKNLARLVEAFRSLAQTIPHHLVIVGRREGFLTTDETLLNMTDELAPRVRFTGEIADDDLHRLYRGAQALVLPSLYEGFGLPPLEAMACGTPAIVSARAALPEICGDAAQYCDPESTESIAGAILCVARSPERRAELRGRGLERARQFTWEATATRVSETLLGILHPDERRWPRPLDHAKTVARTPGL